jgi:hypothetical protein
MLLLPGLTAIRVFQQLLVKHVFSFNEIRLSCSLIVSEGQTNKNGEGSGRLWAPPNLIGMFRAARATSWRFHVVAVTN